MHLTVVPSGTARPADFKYLWGRWVFGFDADRHCQACLIGERAPEINLRMATGVTLELTPPRGALYFYLCGGTDSWAHNLHLAGKPQPGAVAWARARNGLVFMLEDFTALPIPPAPPGTLGKGPEFTTCRNWQFGLHYLSAPPAP